MAIERINQENIYKAFENPFITTLIGARRVGKTTLVNKFAGQNQQSGQWLNLNMDMLELRQKIAAGKLHAHIEEQAKQKIGTGCKLWVAIDEAQKCPELFEQIKVIYDDFKDKNVIKFILTGSGALNLHKLSAESLAGRTSIYNLRGFSLREATALQQQLAVPYESLFDLIFAEPSPNKIATYIDNLTPWNVSLAETLSQQLVWGGLPEVLQLQEDFERLSYLSSYLQTYLEKDIRDLGVITDLKLYQNIMEIVAQQTGSLKDDTRIIGALGCSRDTLIKYRGFLAATLLYAEVYPFIHSALKRLVKSPKGYLVDNGLLSYLTGINNINILEKSGAIGARVENWFFSEAQIAVDRSPYRSDIYYWRTTGGAEVDFVVQHGADIFPFEITFAKKIESKKVNNLCNFLQGIKGVNNKISAKPAGFYIYAGEYKHDEENNIFFIPLWAVS